jgi:hypothetical protein
MIDEIKDMIYDYHGLELTDQHVQQLMDDDPRIAGEVEYWGAIDTCVRELIADSISQKITGQDWPDGTVAEEDFEKWYLTMCEGIGKMEYKPTEHSIFMES